MTIPGVRFPGSGSFGCLRCSVGLVVLTLNGCDQAPLRGQQPKSLRLCRRILTDEVKALRQENERLKQLVADLSVANMLLKKSQS